MSSAEGGAGRTVGPLAIIVVSCATLVLVGLGTWQLERREEKHALIGLIESRATAPAVDLPAAVTDPQAWNYRRVRLRGRFDHAHEMRLSSRSLKGRPGVHVVTPLIRGGAPAVLVNRGFVPLALADPAARAADQVAGPVIVTGIARVPPAPGLFTPPNDPTRGFWLTVDIPAMARAAGLDAVMPLIVEADAAPNPGGWPRGGVSRLTLRDDHLHYALTWYALAVALVVVFVLAARRRSASARKP